MKNSHSTVSSEGFNMPWITLGLLAASGIALWTNRFRIQRFLESQGIDTPLMKGSVIDSIKSGASKLAGSAEHGVKEADRKSFAV
jgi:hypothetical protein